MHISIVVDGPEGLTTQGIKEKMLLPASKLTSQIMFLKIPGQNLKSDKTTVTFRIQSFEEFDDLVEYKSMFYGPRK